MGAAHHASVSQIHTIHARERFQLALLPLGLTAQGEDAAPVDQLEALLALLRLAHHICRSDNRCARLHPPGLLVAAWTHSGGRRSHRFFVNGSMCEPLGLKEAGNA